MKVEQIAVFVENKSGRLAEVSSLLAANGINIRALSVADTHDFGILRLIVNDTDKALGILKAEGFTANKTEVVAVEVADQPGGLSQVLDIINDAGLNVEYMYAFVEKSGENAALIFRIDQTGRAISVLKKAGIKVLGNEEVSNI